MFVGQSLFFKESEMENVRNGQIGINIEIGINAKCEKRMLLVVVGADAISGIVWSGRLRLSNDMGRCGFALKCDGIQHVAGSTDCGVNIVSNIGRDCSFGIDYIANLCLVVKMSHSLKTDVEQILTTALTLASTRFPT